MTTLQNKSKSLFQIKEEYENIIEEIVSAGGEVDEEVFNKLNSIDEDFTQKSENYVHIIKKLDNENDYIDAEIKRLQSRKKVNKNLQKRLKVSLQDGLEAIDKTKLKTPLFTIRIQKNPPVVLIHDEGDVPVQFKEERVSIYIDKKSILQKIKDGEEVPGCRIHQGQSLRIV